MHFVHDGRRSDVLVPDGYAAGQCFPVSLLALSPSPGELPPPGCSHEAVCTEPLDTSAVQITAGRREGLGLALCLRGGGDNKEDDKAQGGLVAAVRRRGRGGGEGALRRHGGDSGFRRRRRQRQ